MWSSPTSMITKFRPHSAATRTAAATWRGRIAAHHAAYSAISRSRHTGHRMQQEPPRWLPPVASTEPAVPAPAPSRPQRTGLRRWLYPVGVAGAVLLKFGVKLKALLLLLPKLKVLTTAGSMLLSVAAYALIWGWKFGAGFVALLFVHEMGHFFQMRREGVKPSWMLFIPFLG